MALLKLEDIKKLLDENKIDLKDLEKLNALEEIKKKNEKIIGLLDKFNGLDFLSDISVRKYEKSEEGSTFKFTLSANVVNNANTGSVSHQ